MIIRNAFDCCIHAYVKTRHESPERFDKAHADYLEWLRSGALRVTQFQVIDSDDEDVVTRINSDLFFESRLNRFKNGTASDVEIAHIRNALALAVKYRSRANSEN